MHVYINDTVCMKHRISISLEHKTKCLLSVQCRLIYRILRDVNRNYPPAVGPLYNL